MDLLLLLEFINTVGLIFIRNDCFALQHHNEPYRLELGIPFLIECPCFFYKIIMSPLILVIRNDESIKEAG